jgi:hypothetical protein
MLRQNFLGVCTDVAGEQERVAAVLDSNDDAFFVVVDAWSGPDDLGIDPALMCGSPKRVEFRLIWAGLSGNPKRSNR